MKKVQKNLKNRLSQAFLIILEAIARDEKARQMIYVRLPVDFIERHRAHGFIGQRDVVQIDDFLLIIHSLHQGEFQLGSDLAAVDLREEHPSKNESSCPPHPMRRGS